MSASSIDRLPLAIVASLLAHHAAGAAVTFYYLSETDPGGPVTRIAGQSALVTPISTAVDGMTVYEAVEAVTERVIEWTAFSTTKTEVSTPTTRTWTFGADASRDQFGPYTTTETARGMSFVVNNNCTINGDGTMVCVEHIVVASPGDGDQPTTVTVEQTHHCAAVHWYTLADANSAPSKDFLSWRRGALVAGLPALGVGLGVLLV